MEFNMKEFLKSAGLTALIFTLVSLIIGMVTDPVLSESSASYFKVVFSFLMLLTAVHVVRCIS
jgi:hypothetical protein